MKRFMLLTFVMFATLAANGVEDNPRSVFIKATKCDGIVGSRVLSSLRNAIRKSSGYRLANSLADNDGTGRVSTIWMVCMEPDPERFGFTAIATIFGESRAVLDSYAVTSNEQTLGSFLCGTNQVEGCGQDIFSEFDSYREFYRRTVPKGMQ